MKDNVEADIRNKIQSSRTIVDLIDSGKRPPIKLVKIALKDLESLKELLQREK